jgi:hypothetical protein
MVNINQLLCIIPVNNRSSWLFTVVVLYVTFLAVTMITDKEFKQKVWIPYFQKKLNLDQPCQFNPSRFSLPQDRVKSDNLVPLLRNTKAKPRANKKAA